MSWLRPTAITPPSGARSGTRVVVVPSAGAERLSAHGRLRAVTVRVPPRVAAAVYLGLAGHTAVPQRVSTVARPSSDVGRGLSTFEVLSPIVSTAAITQHANCGTQQVRIISVELCIVGRAVMPFMYLRGTL